MHLYLHNCMFSQLKSAQRKQNNIWPLARFFATKSDSSDFSKTLNCLSATNPRTGGRRPQNRGRPDPRTGGRPTPELAGGLHTPACGSVTSLRRARGRPTQEPAGGDPNRLSCGVSLLFLHRYRGVSQGIAGYRGVSPMFVGI